MDLDSLNTIKVEGDIPGERLKSWNEVSEVLMDVPRKHLHIVV
jgi:hypothetical protein